MREKYCNNCERVLENLKILKEENERLSGAVKTMSATITILRLERDRLKNDWSNERDLRLRYGVALERIVNYYNTETAPILKDVYKIAIEALTPCEYGEQQ